MSLLLRTLTTKRDIDKAIRSTEDLVLVLRFGKESDLTCMQLDEISWSRVFEPCYDKWFPDKLFTDKWLTTKKLSKTAPHLSNMASIYLVDVDSVPIYVQYFDISLIPATVFFFNGQHIKVDWETPDNTKFIGSFHSKQDFIDVVEMIYRGALKGKMMISSPLDPSHVPKYELLYKDI